MATLRSPTSHRSAPTAWTLSAQARRSRRAAGAISASHPDTELTRIPLAQDTSSCTGTSPTHSPASDSISRCLVPRPSRSRAPTRAQARPSSRRASAAWFSCWSSTYATRPPRRRSERRTPQRSSQTRPTRRCTKRPMTTATRYSTPSGAALCAAFCACAARARAQRHRGQQSLATRLGRQRANICLWTTSCDGASMARRHARTSCKCKNASASPHSCGAGTGSGTSAVRTASVRSSHSRHVFPLGRSDLTRRVAAGILQMLLSCPQEVFAPHWDAVLDTLKWLLALQLPSGNWPHKASRHTRDASSPEEEQLMQWCHGAPALLILLSTLVRRFPAGSALLRVPEPTLRACRTALQRRRARVRALRKGVGLCHGAGGSVYTLLAVADALDTRLPATRRTAESTQESGS